MSALSGSWTDVNSTVSYVEWTNYRHRHVVAGVTTYDGLSDVCPICANPIQTHYATVLPATTPVRPCWCGHARGSHSATACRPCQRAGADYAHTWQWKGGRA